MKSSLKKKIALMLLDVLKRKGLKCTTSVLTSQNRWSGSVIPPVTPPDFQEAQDLLGRLGYEFVTGRRLQTAPKDTSKEIYLKAFVGIHNPWTRRRDEVIWVRMDMDTAMKSLALGFLP